MANNIGKISLDDIMAAANVGLDDAKTPEKTLPKAAEPVKTAEPVKASTATKTAEPVKKVGKVSLDDIMAAAGAGLGTPQEKKVETVVKPEPIAASEPVVVPEPIAASEPVVVSESVVEIEPIAASEPIVASEPVAVPEPIVASEPVITHDPIVVPEPIVASEPVNAEASEADETVKKEKTPSGFLKTMRKIALIDVFAKAIEKKQTGFITWMIINMIIVTLVCLVGGPLVFFGPMVYAISVAIALSPLGEKILRSQNGFREIKSEKVKQRLQPIFDKVYAEAKEKTPDISDKVKLYMSEAECPNAFAVGHNTVCVTRGLLELEDEQIAALLGHEFGHLANKDTEDILVITVGNLFVVLILQFFALIVRFFGGIISCVEIVTGLKKEDSDSWMTRALVYFLTVILVGAWTGLGAMVCKRSNHDAEFAADRFSAELGYAKPLTDAFLVIDGGPPAKGLLATLTASHPNTAERVMRLKEYQYGV